MTTGRTYHLVTPLDPQVEAAWRARAEVFFAECRAAHEAMVERNVAAVLAAEAAAGTQSPQPLRIAA